MTSVVEEIIRIVFLVIFDFLFYWTGEVLLFVLTFGKHKPKWDFYLDQSPTRFVIFSEISTWIGMTFWMAVVWALLYR